MVPISTFRFAVKGFAEIIQADLKCTMNVQWKTRKALQTGTTETRKTKRVKPKYWNWCFYRLPYCHLLHYEIKVSSINKCLEIIILAVIGSVVESLMSLLSFI